MPNYITINVNSWSVTFRARDINRIKVATVEDTCHNLHPWLTSMCEDCPFDYDDCSGEEFLQLLNHLMYNKED